MRCQLSAFSFQRGRNKTSRGMTLIEVVVAVSLMLVIFLGFFGAYAASATLVQSIASRTNASALIAGTIEYARGLPYASVGTVGGTPSGVLVSTESRLVNNIPYTLRTVVSYKDDPANGAGAGDYKVMKVEAIWNIRGFSHSMSAVTYVAP
ncbi:prepilin-type N-terminal cleavage/methylation domain-containing protein [Patescibacteria group bacterium]|nr:MAG: prepilin-type N-terminal cleavage/methylation domain-containing protein [Patescibacteria group bacterium]